MLPMGQNGKKLVVSTPEKQNSTGKTAENEDYFFKPDESRGRRSILSLLTQCYKLTKLVEK